MIFKVAVTHALVLAPDLLSGSIMVPLLLRILCHIIMVHVRSLGRGKAVLVWNLSSIYYIYCQMLLFDGLLPIREGSG